MFCVAAGHQLCFFQHKFRTIFQQTVCNILLLSLDG